MTTAISDHEAQVYRLGLAGQMQASLVGATGAQSEEGFESAKQIVAELISTAQESAGGQSETGYMLDPNAPPDVEALRGLATRESPLSYEQRRTH